LYNMTYHWIKHLQHFLMILDVTTMKTFCDLHGTIYYMFLSRVHAKFSSLTLNNIHLTTYHIMQKLTWGLNFHIDITIFLSFAYKCGYIFLFNFQLYIWMNCIWYIVEYVLSITIKKRLSKSWVMRQRS
jgi:hypothetical protein